MASLRLASSSARWRADSVVAAEASESWYAEHHPDSTAADDRPGMDLITALMSQ
ncbi:hypothetical protein [Nocardia tengchongensis]|uniref:hypothetical protein n=1 Tax=Nocardia tengchongensis TaxID=2055889 RepID=UPI00364B3A5A